MPTYQVRDWDQNFENDRSRTRLECRFVCVPNKQHGMGFCRVMAEPDGAAIYGIWHCIVGACSQQKRRNGWLTADGEKAGSPWGVEDLALKFRRLESEIARAIEVLCSKQVGWLVCHQNSQNDRRLTADSPRTPLEGKGREGKEEKGKGGASRFTPPELATVKLQAAKIGLPELEADHFFNYYESNGWRVGRNPMRSWTHALSNWKLNTHNYGNGKANKANHRNVGVIVGPTNYGKATPRKQRELEAERAALEREVAANEADPPPD
jgi:hypothetical protein